MGALSNWLLFHLKVDLLFSEHFIFCHKIGQAQLDLSRPCPAPVRREPWLLTMEDKWKASIWGLSMFRVAWICRYLCACHCSCFKIFNLSPNFLAFPLPISVSTVSDGERHCPSSPQYCYHFLNWLTYFSKYNQSPTSHCFFSLMPLHLPHALAPPPSPSQHPPSTQPCFLVGSKKGKKRNHIWKLSPSGSLYASKFAHHWTRQYLQTSLKSKLSNSLHDILLKHISLLFQRSCGWKVSGNGRKSYTSGKTYVMYCCLFLLS